MLIKKYFCQRVANNIKDCPLLAKSKKTRVFCFSFLYGYYFLNLDINPELNDTLSILSDNKNTKTTKISKQDM